MVKAKVVKNFTDRITLEDRVRGMEIELTEERAAELAEGGYIRRIQKKKAEKAEK